MKCPRIYNRLQFPWTVKIARLVVPNLYLLIITSLVCGQAGAQNVAINADGSVANRNAMLDIKSNDKGFLMPRMSTEARLRIPNTQGLMVYDISTNSFWYNTGMDWRNFNAASTTLTAASGSWLVTGNTGINEGNFLGTTDDARLNIRVNNQQSGRIDHILNNTFWGYRSGFSITSGNDNTGIGASTLFTLTTGFNNTAVGSNALQANNSGYHNSAFGRFALMSNTAGINNAANGTGSLFNNSTGGFNTASGSNAMYGNITGSWNVANGADAMFSNTEGSFNTANGARALGNNTDGSNNTATGYQAMAFNKSGSNLTATGYRALFANTSGFQNTATGYQSLLNNLDGRDNTANGYVALQENSSGYLNTATGSFALSANKDGWGNVANGGDALRGNSSGIWNTAVGGGALLVNSIASYNTAVGTTALVNSSGSFNTAIGVSTLASNITGTNNTALGYNANVSEGTLTNATAIGNGAIVNASNKVRIGNAAVTVIEGQVPFTFPSDGRFKFQVQEDVTGLDFIMALRPVTYRFDTKRFEEQLRSQNETASTGNWDLPDRNPGMSAAYTTASGIRRSGFIAQEVEAAARKTGYNFSGVIAPNNEQLHYSLSYDAFVVPLVKAMQQQQQQIEDQHKTITELKSELAEIKKMLQNR